MKKLLFVVNNFNIGGPQKSLLALLDNLDYSVFEVHLYSLEPCGTLLPHLHPSVTVLESNPLITAYTLPSKQTLHYIGLLLKKGKIRAAIDFVGAVVKYKQKQDMNPLRQSFWNKHRDELPKLVTHYDAAFGVSSGLSTYFVVDCTVANKKYHWVRGDYSRTPINKTVDTSYFKQLDGSLSVSKECSLIFGEMFPFIKDKIHVFYNLLPIQFYERMKSDTSSMRKDHDLTLLSVTRLDPDKGLDMALEACVTLKKRGIDFVWYILGDGKYRSILESLIVEKGLQDVIVLLGFQLNTFAFIQKCDVFVHPSRSEGKSNAIDEALYLRKPIVVTNYATVREQIEDEVNGFICDMNGEAIANKIEYVVKHAEAINARLLAPRTEKEHNDNDPTSFFLNLC